MGTEYHHLEEHMAEMVWKLRERLAQEDVPPIDIHGRRKHLYSLYKKALRPEYQRDIRRITDVVAVRVIMQNIGGCYAALGIIHQLWKPMPGRFKDYIAQPKPNGYQSLHTTVFGPGGALVEVQVRDQAMHDLAERGVAAHWFYNEQGKPKFAQTVSQKLSWVQELSEWKAHFDSPEQYLDDIKIDALKQRIFCFTPNGDVIDLPEGATVIDFAYHVHSDLGNQCVGGKINGQLSALDSELRSGDVVEIMTDKRRKMPNRDWLKIAKTHAARSHIRRALRDAPSL
jgi:GTP pyrophosphokinase